MKECTEADHVNIYSFCAICDLVDGKPQWQDEIGPDGEHDLSVYTNRDTNFLRLVILIGGAVQVRHEVDLGGQDD